MTHGDQKPVPATTCPVSFVAVGRPRIEDSSVTPIKTLLYFLEDTHVAYRFADCLDTGSGFAARAYS